MSDRHVTLSVSRPRLIFSSTQVISLLCFCLSKWHSREPQESPEALPFPLPCAQVAMGIWAGFLPPARPLLLCVCSGSPSFCPGLKQHFLTGLSLKTLRFLMAHSHGTWSDLSGCVLFIYLCPQASGTYRNPIWLLPCLIPVIASGLTCSAWSPQPSMISCASVSPGLTRVSETPRSPSARAPGTSPGVRVAVHLARPQALRCLQAVGG